MRKRGRAWTGVPSPDAARCGGPRTRRTGRRGHGGGSGRPEAATVGREQKKKKNTGQTRFGTRTSGRQLHRGVLLHRGSGRHQDGRRCPTHWQRLVPHAAGWQQPQRQAHEPSTRPFPRQFARGAQQMVRSGRERAAVRPIGGSKRAAPPSTDTHTDNGGTKTEQPKQVPRGSMSEHAVRPESDGRMQHHTRGLPSHPVSRKMQRVSSHHG